MRGFRIPLHRGEKTIVGVVRKRALNIITIYTTQGIPCWRHPFHATEEEAYHYDKPMNGLENGEGGRLTHTLVAQWRPPSPFYRPPASPRKIDLAPRMRSRTCPGGRPTRGFLVKTRVCRIGFPVVGFKSSSSFRSGFSGSGLSLFPLRADRCKH